MMQIEHFRHRTPLRVRWAEVDMQAVVFNGHYLAWCDVCVTEYWRAIGFTYPQGLVGQGVDTFVRKAAIEYHQPARYDDELLVCGRTVRLGNSSLGFAVAFFRADATDTPLVEAELIYVCVDAATTKPTHWPAAIRERISEFELVAPLAAPVVGR
jgi:acyl-CoA thioester hydrolase